MILESHPWLNVVAECASGAEAIEAAALLNPHIMLMDINMAPVNGFEATRKITRLYPHIKIIGVSINNQPSYARNMLQIGARGYVTKNSTAKEMIDAIIKVHNGDNYICKEVREKMDN